MEFSKLVIICALSILGECGNYSAYNFWAVKWRSDGRCGEDFVLENGSPSECDPKSERPCCSAFGFCGKSKSHCTCKGCRDFRGKMDLCYFKFSEIEGMIESPNYPQNYPNNADCRIDIARTSVKQCGVKLIMEDFDVESDPDDSFCQKDWLAAESCVPEGGAKICGNETGATYQYVFQPGAMSLRLQFQSDSQGTRKGFRIRYKVVEECMGLFLDTSPSIIPGSGGALCQTRIQDLSGTINTPYHPKKYPDNLDCIYEFVRADQFVCGVRMRAQQFELEPPLQTLFGGACSDFFHTPSCGFLCGKLNFSWTAKFQPGATSLRFHFHSDESSGFAGFQISFEQIYRCS
ncbi:complement C1s subcomponent-like [Artemia franciscana]|uniref:Cubilin n=1 Tax=Artemia franciscana TaxID=6661 RepID=A0AA88I0A0_ARTSF|nr:hypothetical protein QYM36_006375 [Artemia franciscana]